jgi:D-alanyl-D-alanine carboxypeptidase
MGAKKRWFGVLAVVAMIATTMYLGGGRERHLAAPIGAGDVNAVEVAPKAVALDVPLLPGETVAAAPRPTSSGIELGAVVYDRRTGKDVLLDEPDRQFESASLVKLLIGLDAMERGEPTSTVAHMLSVSDDNEANRLWGAGGAGRIVDKWAKRIGLTATRAPANPNKWGDTTTTARDVAAIYRYLFDHPNGDVVVKALHAMTNFGADGFDQRFGIPNAANGRRWAAKQGWACCSGKRTLHTTGLVGENDRYIVVVLTSHSEKSTWASASKVVTKIASRALIGR